MSRSSWARARSRSSPAGILDRAIPAIRHTWQSSCARVREWLPGASETHALAMGFVAMMIVFNGPHWNFQDSPVQGPYSRKLVYGGVSSLRPGRQASAAGVGGGRAGRDRAHAGTTAAAAQACSGADQRLVTRDGEPLAGWNYNA